jgi:hypothetical protein
MIVPSNKSPIIHIREDGTRFVYHDRDELPTYFSEFFLQKSHGLVVHIFILVWNYMICDDGTNCESIYLPNTMN